MTKIAIITDTHFGVQDSSQMVHDANEKFFGEVFFPKIDQLGIETVLHLGDLTHKRQSISFWTAHNMRCTFFHPLADRRLHLYGVVGNHDSYYRDTLQVNSWRELAGWLPRIHVIEFPTETTIGDCRFLLLPYSTKENQGAIQGAMAATSARVAAGHLDIQGFLYRKGVLSEKGFRAGEFSRFELVLSGHYHKKQTKGNITYLGSHSQQDWSDFGDERGFHVLDTSSLELEFVPNPYNLYEAFVYDDVGFEDFGLLPGDYEKYRGKHVKVIVKNKENPFLFDSIIGQLEKGGPAGVQIVDDHKNANLVTDEEVLEGTEDTITAIKKYVEGVETQADKARVESLVLDLYNEALNLES